MLLTQRKKKRIGKHRASKTVFSPFSKMFSMLYQQLVKLDFLSGNAVLSSSTNLKFYGKELTLYLTTKFYPYPN